MPITTSSANKPTPRSWTDDPIVVGYEPKAVYLTELRRYLDTDIHGHYHTFPSGSNTGPELPTMSISWTDTTITPQVTDVKAVHWIEVQNTLLQLTRHNHISPYGGYTSNYNASISFTETISPGYVTDVKASQINEIRTKADLLRSHTHTTCCECECTCTCQCTCTCTCRCRCDCDCDCTCDWHT